MYQTRDLKPSKGFFGKSESKKEQVVRATGTDTESMAIRVKKVITVN